MQENKEELNESYKAPRALKIIGIGAACIVSGVLGYKYGCFRTECAISRGIQKCWDSDITLKAHMWDALDAATKQM